MFRTNVDRQKKERIKKERKELKKRLKILRAIEKSRAKARKIAERRERKQYEKDVRGRRLRGLYGCALNPLRQKKKHIMETLGVTGKRLRALQKRARRGNDIVEKMRLGVMERV